MIRGVESHRSGDLLFFLKFCLVDHDEKLIRLGYSINLIGNVASDFRGYLLLPGREYCGGYPLIHIGIKVERKHLIIIGCQAGK